MFLHNPTLSTNNITDWNIITLKYDFQDKREI
jgi:hypothetical protein